MALPKSVLLIISGSVASYKALELIRLLRAQDVLVTTILSKGGAEFITPLAVSSLSGTKTYTDLFSLTDETEMGHIQLSRIAELVLVAPASANLLAKMATGLADDLATTALLATNKPVFVAPAMNHKMWSHPATRRNVAQLVQDGIRVIPPTVGDMACGETGVGRMAEPAAILEFLARHPGLVPGSPTPSATLQGIPAQGRDDGLPLKGRRAIVTSGPTIESIDPVRYLGNRSSGKQGHAIAQALADAGAEVTLLCSEVNLPDPRGVKIVRIHNAESMLEAAIAALPADIFIGAAAVADWKPSITAPQKIKKQNMLDILTLEFLPTVDVVASIAQQVERPALVVGFAAETEKLLEHARAKRLSKGCDWILANEVGASLAFGQDDNSVTLITATSEESWPLTHKTEIATRLVQKIAAHFNEATTKETVIPVKTGI
jgi:phosphopantothenoylcysteine decarboxylase/phosphopantothenate--cysteine ligase